jgi:hypothetical protein
MSNLSRFIKRISVLSITLVAIFGFFLSINTNAQSNMVGKKYQVKSMPFQNMRSSVCGSIIKAVYPKTIVKVVADKNNGTVKSCGVPSGNHTWYKVTYMTYSGQTWTGYMAINLMKAI